MKIIYEEHICGGCRGRVLYQRGRSAGWRFVEDTCKCEYCSSEKIFVDIPENILVTWEEEREPEHIVYIDLSQTTITPI